MSTGFRLFLLTVLAFAAIWIYRFRGGDLTFWLTAPEVLRQRREENEMVRSPVDRAERLPVYTVRIVGADTSDVQERVRRESYRRRYGGGLMASQPEVWADPGNLPPGEPSRGAWTPEGDPDGGFDDGWIEGEGGEGELVDQELSESGGAEEGLSDGGGAEEELPGGGPGEGGEAAEVEEGHGGGSAFEGEPPPAPRAYRVKAGDSLAKIARVELGRESRWREIEALNREALRGKEFIQPGMTLLLPATP